MESHHIEKLFGALLPCAQSRPITSEQAEASKEIPLDVLVCLGDGAGQGVHVVLAFVEQEKDGVQQGAVNKIPHKSGYPPTYDIRNSLWQ